MFLNQVALAAVAGDLRRLAPAQTRIILLSHGAESTDLLHLIRLRRTLPISGRVRPTAAMALGRVIAAESATRRCVDAVVALSAFDVEIERWIGARRVGWLPRLIEPDPLDWRPHGARLGYVGTLDHGPNLEGLVLALDAMDAQLGPAARVRTWSADPRISARGSRLVSPALIIWAPCSMRNWRRKLRVGTDFCIPSSARRAAAAPSWPRP